MNNSPQTTINTAQSQLDEAVNDRATALLGVYQEICKSHQAVDEFRMKLLGLLPLASLAGIFLLGRSDIQSGSAGMQNHSQLIAFIGIFAAIFTLALFMYEIRGILKCHDLILSGRKIENTLGIHGQFWVCEKQQEESKTHSIFNAITTACFTYAFVFTGWVFLTLHNGFGFRNLHCLITAPLAGLITGLIAYGLIKRCIPS
ncbi:MAG: hypothetical protein WAQ99_02980 [Pyrinomonadaceae bacterium]